MDNLLKQLFLSRLPDPHCGVCAPSQWRAVEQIVIPVYSNPSAKLGLCLWYKVHQNSSLRISEKQILAKETPLLSLVLWGNKWFIACSAYKYLAFHIAQDLQHWLPLPILAQSRVVHRTLHHICLCILVLEMRERKKKPHDNFHKPCN